jgi:hypothetical protein
VRPTAIRRRARCARSRRGQRTTPRSSRPPLFGPALDVPNQERRAGASHRRARGSRSLGWWTRRGAPKSHPGRHFLFRHRPQPVAIGVNGAARTTLEARQQHHPAAIVAPNLIAVARLYLEAPANEASRVSHPQSPCKPLACANRVDLSQGTGKARRKKCVGEREVRRVFGCRAARSRDASFPAYRRTFTARARLTEKDILCWGSPRFGPTRICLRCRVRRQR